MGEVFLAEHPRLPRRDALKILSAEVMTSDTDFRERFHREADLAATLWHPHIVGVHDRGEFEGHLWISMDYVEGTDAGQLARDRYRAGMPAGDVRIIITAVANALDYAHQRDVLHRDIKPANILLTQPDDEGDRRIFLADFGIARQLADVSGLTATNMTVGTVTYAAPEQLMGADIDGRADQYALAATAFHLLTGAPPYHHSNPVAIIGQHLNAAPPKLSDRRPDLAHLDQVLSKALAKDPAKRFDRCRDFARALAEQTATNAAFSAARTTPASRKPAAPAPPPERSVANSPKRWIALAAALGVIVLAILAWHPWQHRQSTSASTSQPPAVAPSTAAPESSAAPAPPPPVGAPTSAAPAPTQVITAVAVVNGQPANGYHEAPSPGMNNVFECDASPAAVDSGIYRCPPWAADADVCWPATSGTLLCSDDPWKKELHRFSYTNPLPAVRPQTTPIPFALLLDDGTQCRMRNGGAEAGRDDGLVSAYWCHSESSVLATPEAVGRRLVDAIIDRSHPLWTVKVGPVMPGNLPPPQTHAVTTAWFAGN
jgi:serine/threonine protein kinase, bacterial